MNTTEVKQQIALQHHLRHNHYPPVSAVFVPVALEAAQLVAGGSPQDLLTLPNGKRLPAGQIVEDLHLAFFVEALQTEDGEEG